MFNNNIKINKIKSFKLSNYLYISKFIIKIIIY